MAHITFIHGISNKPPPEALLQLWRSALADGEGPVDLQTASLTSSMIYWADVLYGTPDPSLDVHESGKDLELAALEKAPALKGLDLETADFSEQKWTLSFATKLGVASSLVGDDDSVPPEDQADGSFERVPLPWFIKQRFLKAFLRDVHHYLFNELHSPRNGQSFKVQDEIRRRTLESLSSVNAKPHIVVSHSMGTVIAYDCLKRVPDCPKIDHLITIGSPLGIDEVQDKLLPEWTRSEGFPSEKVDGAWVNIFDHLDPVAALDPFLSSDFRHGGIEKVVDIHEPNHGRWRHSIDKYLRGPLLRQKIRELIA